MRRYLALSIGFIVLGSIVLGFFYWLFQPLLEGGLTGDTLTKFGFRSTFVIAMSYVLYLHLRYPPERCKPKWRGTVYWLGVTALIVTPVGAVVLFINVAGGISIFVVSAVCGLLLKVIWSRAVDPALVPARRARSSPAGDIYNEGRSTLEQETNPAERKQLALALQRWKDGWRLK
jgi:hypothetical protein